MPDNEEKKRIFVERLTRTPSILSAMQSMDISRATYYRLRKDDPVFRKNVDKALKEGVNILNDLAMNRLMVAMDSGDLGANKFWLQHNHPDFMKKTVVKENAWLVSKIATKEKDKIIKGLEEKLKFEKKMKEPIPLENISLYTLQELKEDVIEKYDTAIAKKKELTKLEPLDNIYKEDLASNE